MGSAAMLLLWLWALLVATLTAAAGASPTSKKRVMVWTTDDAANTK
jgi:hypothetical protein